MAKKKRGRVKLGKKDLKILTEQQSSEKKAKPTTVKKRKKKVRKQKSWYKKQLKPKNWASFTWLGQDMVGQVINVHKLLAHLPGKHPYSYSMKGTDGYTYPIGFDESSPYGNIIKKIRKPKT